MTKTRTFVFALLFLTLAAVPFFISPASGQQSDRAKQIGGKFMCMCGCNQVLTQCNHVGCTVSASMLKGLDAAVARGDSENTITQALVQEFGTKVYAEPPKSGFSLVAWSLPGIYLFLGTILVVAVISRWRKQPIPQAAIAGYSSGISAELLERGRAQAARETQD